MISSRLAVEPILGLILSSPIPVTSAENMLLFFISLTGISANEKTTIPSPPIHCVSERQNRRAWVMESISVMTVAPVVVKPDIVSKKALAISIFCIRINGIMPITENITQERVTIKNESARVKRLLSLSILLRRMHILPMTKLMDAERRYAHQSCSS